MIPEIHLRRAEEADQRAIRRMVTSECLNPRDVHWQNFIIAEADGEIAGIGQIRVHQQGSHVIKELGSLIVRPEYRGQGLGKVLVDALEARAGYPLYLMCAQHNVDYYQRLGYRVVEDSDIPPSLLPPAARWLMRNIVRAKVYIMRKEGP